MIASIIIPVYNEEKYIEACLDSILLEGVLPKETEIIIVDGMSMDRTVDMIRQYQQEHSDIILLENPKKIVPVAMNIGIKKARGTYIIRLDAHATYTPEYVRQMLAWHQKLDADNVGGVVVTEVKNRTVKSNAIKAVLSSRFGVGNSDFRTGVKALKSVDTVPFGCYPQSVFDRYGLYDERLIRNQDIELNKRIVNGGGKIYLLPDVQCTYYARETLQALAKNNFANGLWNMLTAYYTKTFRSLSLRHFVPLLFVLSLLLPGIASLFYPKLFWVSLLSLLSYLSLVIIVSLKLQQSKAHFGYLILGFLVLHLSYGAGSLWGLCLVCMKKIKGKDV